MKLRAASERGAASETQKEGLPVKLTIGAASKNAPRRTSGAETMVCQGRKKCVVRGEKNLCPSPGSSKVQYSTKAAHSTHKKVHMIAKADNKRSTNAP